MKKKVLRIATVPVSLDVLLKGQLKMLNEMYEVVAVSSPGKELEEVGKREGGKNGCCPYGKTHLSYSGFEVAFCSGPADTERKALDGTYADSESWSAGNAGGLDV